MSESGIVGVGGSESAPGPGPGPVVRTVAISLAAYTEALEAISAPLTPGIAEAMEWAARNTHMAPIRILLAEVERGDVLVGTLLRLLRPAS